MRVINEQDVFDIIDDLRDCMTVEGYCAMVERVKALPSAQPEVLACGEGELSAYPEIIRCKDCNYYTPVTAHCEIRGKGLYLIRGMEDFCSRAERRTDE